MKKILVILVLAILPVLACSQAREESPVTIEWNGNSSQYQIGIQEQGSGYIDILETVNQKQYSIDLMSINKYGLFVVMVRGVEFTEPDMYSYSDWIRSDIDEDVIMVDGEPYTFYIMLAKEAEKTQAIRIKE